eukprot:1187056-Prorocentrum_minimum.AAC.1
MALVGKNSTLAAARPSSHLSTIDWTTRPAASTGCCRLSSDPTELMHPAAAAAYTSASARAAHISNSYTRVNKSPLTFQIVTLE